MTPPFLKDNPIALIGVGIVAIGMVTSNSSGKFQSMQQTSQLVRQQREATQQERVQLQLAAAEIKQNEPIANGRYERNCIMVSALISPGEYTGLSIGQPVIDRVRNVPFADGNEVCDAYGMTAQIVDGVAALPARTGDRALIEQAMQRTPALYRNPAQ
jgi:hypothetical protein